MGGDVTHIEKDETVSAYVSTELADKAKIENIRESMMWRTDADAFYRRVTPHITVVPPFRVPRDNLTEVQGIVNSVELEDTHVEVKGAGVWPNIDTPYVVLLDVDVNLNNTRNTLISQLREVGAKRIKEPVKPHITLFKTKGFWSTIPDTLKVQLQSEIMDYRVIQDTEIEGLKLITN